MAKNQKQNHKSIGIEVNLPKKTCEDSNCPFHGEIKVRGKSFVCTVVKAKMQKSAVVTWSRKRFVPKYERYENRKTKIKVHVPPCIEISDGEKVRIVETRPLSKTKNFVVIEKVGEDFSYKTKLESKDNVDNSLRKKEETEEKKEENETTDI